MWTLLNRTDQALQFGPYNCFVLLCQNKRTNLRSSEFESYVQHLIASSEPVFMRIDRHDQISRKWKSALYPTDVFLQSRKCMIKIFRGGQGWWHHQNPLPPTNNFCLYPPPILRCFWKDPLMTPPPHFKHLSLLPPSPSTTPPPPPKNFDCTQRVFELLLYSRKLYNDININSHFH